MPFDVGTVVINADGRVAYASTYFCVLVGVRPSEVAGMFYLDFFFPEDLAEAKALLELNKQSAAPVFRFRLRRSDASEVWVKVKGSPIQDPSGNFHGVTATVTTTEAAPVRVK